MRRGTPGIGVGGGGGGHGGDNGALVPVAAPARVEEHRRAESDAMGHRLDRVPGDALAGLLV